MTKDPWTRFFSEFEEARRLGLAVDLGYETWERLLEAWQQSPKDVHAALDNYLGKEYLRVNPRAVLMRQQQKTGL